MGAIEGRVGAGNAQPSDENRMRKITVEVREADLARALEFTGQGITETVRAGVRKLAEAWAQREFRKLRGTYQFTIDLDELREDRSW